MVKPSDRASRKNEPGMIGRLPRVYSHIESNRQPFLERLFDYLSHPSISAQGVGIEEVSSYIAGVLDRIGLNSEIVPTAGCPVVLARREAGSDRPTVLLYGHYDVQPPDPLDRWISPPFEPTIRDGRIYARGVGDNKGQHFAQILAIESLLACNASLPCNVIVFLEGEEEVGSPNLAQFARSHGAKLAADLVITADGPVHESGRACITFGVRGVASFELRATGAKSDLHSGNWGNVAPQPLWTLVHLLHSMRDEHGRITIDGFYDRVDAPTPLELEALAALPFDEAQTKRALSVEQFDVPPDRSLVERLSLWPTMTINGLHGGYDGPGTKTVLPCTATAKCDVRLVESQEADEILDKIEAHVGRVAPHVEFVRMGGMDPSKTRLDSPFVEPLRSAVQHAQGEPPLLIPAMGGSLPEYVFTKILGIPAFGVPYANPDEANHVPNENLEVERFFAGIRTGAALLTHLGAMYRPA